MKAPYTEADNGRRSKNHPVVTATLWNYCSAAVATILQLGYTAYTGRTVSVSAFGAFASAQSIIQLLGYFANAGLGTAVLRAREPSQELLAAALKLGAVSGPLCCVLIQATATMWADLWNAPQATPMLRVLGCQFLILPFAAIATAWLGRLMAQRTVAVIEMASQSTGLLASTVLLTSGWNPVGLAAAPVVSQLCAAALAFPRLLLLLRALRPPGRPHRRVRLWKLARTTGFLAGHSLVQYATNTLPLWTASATLGLTAVGNYSRAVMFTGIPLALLASGLSRVTTPSLSRVLARVQSDGQALIPRIPGRQVDDRVDPSFTRAVTDVLLAASALSFLPFAFLAGIGPKMLRLLLGPGWADAASLVPWLCLASSAAMMYSTALSVDTVRGAFRQMVRAQVVTATAIGGTAIAAAATGSIHLLALAAGAGPLCGHAVQMRTWRTDSLLESRRLWDGYRVHAALALLLYAAGASIAWLADGRLLRAVPVLLCTVCALGVCWRLRSRQPLYRIATARGLLSPQ
ncbi:oligosaccharide flippase family protein [Streptomyces caeni]|uniref:Oligosaccharide flippase family protein n=1 Tax=Streptomyces caeni TaxID=2307231 RepID=A0ABW4ISG1_9ACTN